MTWDRCIETCELLWQPEPTLAKLHLSSQAVAAHEKDSRTIVNKLANVARNCIEIVSTLSRFDAASAVTVARISS